MYKCVGLATPVTVSASPIVLATWIPRIEAMPPEASVTVPLICVLNERAGCAAVRWIPPSSVTFSV